MKTNLFIPPNSKLFQQYVMDPNGTESAVRKFCGIPEDRYFAVAIWPPKEMGKVRIERVRMVKHAKISKSDELSQSNA